MKDIWTIAWRDFRSYFTSPIAYIIIALFLFILGWMFFNMLDIFLMSQMQQNPMGMGRPQMNLNDGVIRPLFGNMNVVFLFMVPFITMRLFAEERKNHTIELMMTAPITLTQIILGKFLSALLLVLTMLLCTSVYPIVLVIWGNPDGGIILSSYVGTILISFCNLAIGLLFSAVTDNQIVAAVCTFCSLLFFWLVNWAAQSAGAVWGDFLNYLSLIGHFNNFSLGVINSTDVVYYLSVSGLCLFICHQILDSYRWRA